MEDLHAFQRKFRKGWWASRLCQPFSGHEPGWAPTGHCTRTGRVCLRNKDPSRRRAIWGQLFLPAGAKKGKENLPQP